MNIKNKMSNKNTKTIYLQQGNTQFCGKVKIGQIVLTNQQFNQLLLDNVSWKRYISYPIGQVCSRKTQNLTVFYYSIVANNLGNDPLTDNDLQYWKPVVLNDDNVDDDLIFKIPKIQYGDTLKLQLQFSQSNNFQNVLSIDSSTNFQQSVFFISNGKDNIISQFNNSFIDSTFSNQILIFKKSNISNVYNYFRYRWYSTQSESYTKYYFGTVGSKIQTFDVDYNGFDGIHVDNINVVGNGTQANPIKLKNEITINKVLGENNFSIETSDSDITINSANGNGQLNLNVSNINLNGNDVNKPNGIVVLNQNGKINEELYVDGDFNSRLLPLKKNVTQQQYGNPLVIYKTGQVQTDIQNDSSTILLIQGANKNNVAVGVTENVLYNNYISQQKQQDFKGGYILNIDKTQQPLLIDNVLQIAIQVKKQSLSTMYYKSVFQHFCGQYLCYLGINQNGFVYGLQSNLSNIIQFQNLNQSQYYKFVVQYKYQNGVYFSEIYLNNELRLTYQFQSNPLINVNDNDYIKIYIGQQVSNRSNDIHLNGLNTWWRLLKVDISLKNNQLLKEIGQPYYNQANINYKNIKVDYNWDSSIQTKDAVIFGKKNGVPYIFPYPQTLYTLPTATRSVKGGIIIGSGLYVDQNGVVSVNSGDSQLDLGTYIQVSNQQLNNDGNINIRSKITPNSSVTIQSGDIQNNNVGGKLFLGSEKESQHYSQLSWVDKNTSIKLGQLQSKIRYGETNISLNQNSVNIVSQQLNYNGNKLNKANGLVKLNANGKIDNQLLNITSNDGNILFENKLVVYDVANNQSFQCNGIKAGTGVTIGIQNGVAVINMNENAKVRQDLTFGYAQLNYNEQSGRYTYVVQNVNLGGFVVQDNYGYLIYPLQRQIQSKNANGNSINSVQIDFTQFVGQHGLREVRQNQNVIQYKIRFIRGYRGNDGQLTQDQALNLVLSYLM